MAYITQHLPFFNFSFITSPFTRLSNYIEHRKRANETYKELNKLSNRELSDIGISRSDIRAIAEDTFWDVPENQNLKGWS